jgi:hypothetical protein
LRSDILIVDSSKSSRHKPNRHADLIQASTDEKPEQLTMTRVKGQGARQRRARRKIVYCRRGFTPECFNLRFDLRSLHNPLHTKAVLPSLVSLSPTHMRLELVFWCNGIRLRRLLAIIIPLSCSLRLCDAK